MPKAKTQLPMGNEILILVGVPGSGKSTFANELVSRHDRYVKVSRDDIRKMTKDSYAVIEDREGFISAMQDAAIKAALSQGKSVVLDNAHCKIKHIEDIINKYGRENAVSLKVVGADLSMKEIYARNLSRDKAVPEEIIDRMYKGFKHVIKNKGEIDKLIAAMATPPEELSFGKQDVSLPKAIIVDIDGTIAHMGDSRGPFDWHKVDVDAPDINVLNIVRSLSPFYKVIFLTGRDAAARTLTKAWLDVYYGQDYEMLITRGSNDYRKDNIIKKEIYNTHIKGKYYIEAVFDDRDQVVNMWRTELGLKCLQVDYGNF